MVWPGVFHGLYRLWGCKESDMTERLSLNYIRTLLCIHSVRNSLHLLPSNSHSIPSSPYILFTLSFALLDCNFFGIQSLPSPWRIPCWHSFTLFKWWGCEKCSLLPCSPALIFLAFLRLAHCFYYNGHKHCSYNHAFLKFSESLKRNISHFWNAKYEYTGCIILL